MKKKKKKKYPKSLDPSDVFDTKLLKTRRIVPSPIKRSPKTKRLPPIRTMSLKAQMDLTGELPESIEEKLRGHRPNRALREKGVPEKIALAPYSLADLELVSTYMITPEADHSKYYLELFVPHSLQAFWLMAMVFKPNHPYLAIITAEEDSLAAPLLSTYLINYYLSLFRDQTEGGVAVHWYRSLEFVPLKQNIDDSGIVVVQCRHPSWVDTQLKLLRTLHNVRASYENTTLILIMDQDDIGIVPYILANEPYGTFVKVTLKADALPEAAKPKKVPAINTVLDRIKTKTKKRR
jgi:hypothetical protein